MQTRPIGRPPSVIWSYPDDEVDWSDPDVEEEMPGKAAIRKAVQELVDAIWRRLPQPARAVIALDLQGIILEAGSDGPAATFEPNQILLTVGDYEPSPAWALPTMWLLAEILAHVFWWSVVARMAGGHPGGGCLPETCQGTPAAAWYLSFLDDSHELGSYFLLTTRMAAAIAIAWGFGEEWAAAMDVGEHQLPCPGDENYLRRDVGKLYWLFRPRPLHTGRMPATTNPPEGSAVGFRLGLMM